MQSMNADRMQGVPEYERVHGMCSDWKLTIGTNERVEEEQAVAKLAQVASLKVWF